MSKTIIIRKRSWLERHPIQIRRLLVRLIFSEATQYGWQIVMEGQHHDTHITDPAKMTAPKDEPMTDEQWAMLMGHR